MGKLVWTGARASDIKYTGDFFKGSITLYGDGKNENRSFCLTQNLRINHNNITDEQTEFMNYNEIKMIEEDEAVQFMSYNPNLVYGYENNIRERTVCLNSKEIMSLLDSKIAFREFASPYVPVLNSKTILGKECTIELLRSNFPNSMAWIIQADIASGGYQTYCLTNDNKEQVFSNIVGERKYLISPYYRVNIPINIHAIIYEEEIMLTPGSIQIETLDRNRLLYRGADYIAYRDIDSNIRTKFQNDVEILCKEIQKKGYRGILGIDAMIIDGVARILEVNNRFQASTILINKALYEANLPSLHELNYEAFHKSCSSKITSGQLRNISIGYSIYAFIKEETIVHAYNILNRYKHEKAIVDYIDDGYIPTQMSEDDAYLFKLIFNTNLVSVIEDKTVRLHPNIATPSDTWYQSIIQKIDFKKLKISLLNQGVILEPVVIEYLEKNGGMRPGVYHAVDLILEDTYIVNSPLSVKFTSLSPFKVTINDNNKLLLTYYGTIICTVRIDFADELASVKTKRGIPLNCICLCVTDRLRIQNNDFCTFKENNIPCRFCEVKYRKIRFDIDDIKESIDIYFNSCKTKFRHILIGGLSNDMGKEKPILCEMIKYIREYSNMPIYLMSLPSLNTDDIEEYIKLGVTELGFNIEIYDRELAKKYMPGKGYIPLDRYEHAMKKAVSLLGNKGAVRSAFVVGLEDTQSLMDGIRFLCERGVAPILSVFRPIPFTEMENMVPPENEWLLEVYYKAEEICKEYGLSIGPDCPACQNNTLSFDKLKKR